jgi:DnaJ like chaperone protein
MAYLGKIIGGSAGFLFGGPIGAVVGAALGHAADTGAIRNPFQAASPHAAPFRVAAMLGRRDQLFSVTAVVLSAKLAKCDGPVKREEIDAFKRLFRIPPAAVRDIGRLFDQARDSAEDFEEYADQLGAAFRDNPSVLEDTLVALFAIARADGPINRAELDFLRRVHHGLRLDQIAWDRAWNGAPRPNASSEPDPYEILGVPPDTPDADIRARWRALMRENHPDGLAARGVPAEFIARASERVARINAAWDRVKRERGL